jgi:hypothetical protein
MPVISPIPNHAQCNKVSLQKGIHHTDVPLQFRFGTRHHPVRNQANKEQPNGNGGDVNQPMERR